MSTPTPRTDAAQLDATNVSEEGGPFWAVEADFARTLETELTTALARVAALDKRRTHYLEQIEGFKQLCVTLEKERNEARDATERIRAYAIGLEQRLDSARGHLAETPAGGGTEQDAWQPIETAPKDGIRIIGFSPDWVHEDYNREGIRECFCDGDGVWYSPDWDNEFDVYQNGKGQPTLWQPLPPPPQGKETQK